MILRVLLYFGGLMTILMVAGTIGLVPGLRPDAEAQVYGTTPIPPSLEVAPVRPVVEAIPLAPPAVTPSVVVAPVTPATPATPVTPAAPATPVTPPAIEVEPLAPAPAVDPPAAVPTNPAPSIEVQPVRPAPVTETVAQVTQRAPVTQQAPVALPSAGTGGLMQADSPLQLWLLVSLAGILSVLAAATTAVRRSNAQRLERSRLLQIIQDARWR
jgi:hypothetical protein